MLADNDALLTKGKNYCFRLLKVRQRSQAEIEQRLKARQYPSSMVRKLVQYLSGLDLLDDAKFAQDWAKMRLSKDFGHRRISSELRQKGIAEAVIKSLMQDIGHNADEEKTVQKIAHKRFLRYKNLDAPIAQRRLYGYLIRRGFSENVILKTIRSYDNDND